MSTEIATVPPVSDKSEVPTNGAEPSAKVELGEKRKAEDQIEQDDEKKQKVTEGTVNKGKGKSTAQEEEEEPAEQHIDSDEDLDNLIVSGKRRRKPVDYTSKEAMQAAGIDPDAKDEDEDDEDANVDSLDEDDQDDDVEDVGDAEKAEDTDDDEEK